MLGKATFTMVASTKAMKKPASKTASANHDDLGAGAKVGRPAAAGVGVWVIR